MTIRAPQSQDSVELSRLIKDLKIDIQEALTLLDKAGHSAIEADGIIRVEQASADALLTQYQNQSRVRVSRGGYHIPEWMKSSHCPWVEALNQIYQSSLCYPASISPSQGELLRALVHNIAPRTVVEIGCFIGTSSLWIASGLAEHTHPSTLYSIDTFLPKFPWLPFHLSCLVNPKKFIRSKLEDAGLTQKVILIEADSHHAAATITQWLPDSGIDLLFIDGDHTIEGCSRDFLNFKDWVNSNGYIVFHDIYPENCGHKGPRHVIDQLLVRLPEFEWVEVLTSPVNYGMAILRKR